MLTMLATGSAPQRLVCVSGEEDAELERALSQSTTDLAGDARSSLPAESGLSTGETWNNMQMFKLSFLSSTSTHLPFWFRDQIHIYSSYSSASAYCIFVPI